MPPIQVGVRYAGKEDIGIAVLVNISADATGMSTRYSRLERRRRG